VGAPTTTYTVSVINTVTVASNGPVGTSSFANTDANDKVEFDIIINNPCWQTTYNAISFSPDPATTPFTVADGSTGSISFQKPTNGIEDLREVPLICGSTEYAVYADTSDTALQSAWVYVEATTTTNLFDLKVDTTVDLSLMGTETSVVKTVYVKSTLTDYPNVVNYNSVDITLTAAACDCSYLLWDNPTTTTPIIILDHTASTQTIPEPIPNTSNRATYASFDNCYLTSNNCATTGTFSAGSVTYNDGVTAGGTTLPTWITFSSSGSIVQTIDITAPDGSYNGVHTLYATFTPTNGSPITYTAMSFEIQCAVTSFTLPTTPAEPTFDLSYIIYDDPLTIDLSSLVYVEAPTCLYTTTSVYTWVGLDSSFMTIYSSNNAAITIQSNDKTKAANSPFAVTFQRVMTVTSAGQTTAGGATTFLNGASDLLSFTITVTDPCTTGTINDPTLTAMSVQNGGSGT
jgi:hypothetical protein